jgi:ABC-type sugar transport system substrate-binding protein
MSRILISVMGETDSHGTQAELVRRAVNRNCLALVVEPDDPADSELAKAVTEARERGLPVVVMGRPLTGLPPSMVDAPGSAKTAGPAIGSLVNVVPEDFATSARLIVAAAIRNARNAKLSPEAAVLTINPSADRLAKDRAAALREALRNAGVTTVELLPITADSPKAKADLVALLRSNRKPAMVLATDLTGLTAASLATAVLGDDHLFVVGGYSWEDALASSVNGGEYAAIAVFSMDRLVAKAVKTAVLASRGERLPDRVQFEVPVLESPDNSAAPRMYRGLRRTENEREPAEKKREDHR